MFLKIELRYFYGWDDACWTEEDEAGLKELRFETIESAQNALDEFFADVRAAVARGDMVGEENESSYRIVRAVA